MADNDQSKIRYDDFIGNVQPDPAKPESTIMLSGFVGHGPEGHARVYPDPTLGSWYDVPEGDILHSTPIADSKLGGSYVWVRASSEIKPGSAAPAASEAEAVQPQQAAGVGFDPTPRTFCFVCDLPKAAVAMQPTPATHCFICPPPTWGPCRTALCDNMQAPTPATHCFICPPHTQNCTPATICTLHGHCPPQHSVPPTLCAVPQTLPCSLLCQADPRGGAAPAAMALPHTAATLCTQFGCPQDGMVPTVWCSWVGCPPHGPAGGAPEALQQANTGVTVCVTDCVPPGNEMMRAAVGMTPTPRTHCRICDPPMMAAAAMQPTPTVQTHCFICPPHTQAVHCWTAPVVCNLLPTQPVVCGVLPPSFGCPQGGAQPQHAMAMAAPAHPNTAATLCTQQPACPPHTVHNSLCVCPTPSAFHPCGQNTAATVCTQPPVCQPHTVHNSICICPTPGAQTHALCGPNTVNTPCVTFVCPTLGVCPTVAACTPNGVFTPFGR